MPATAARLTALALAAVFAASASAQGTAVGVTFLPGHVVQGDQARLSASVRPAGARCTLAVVYRDGTKQQGLAPVAAAGGHAAWTWQVPTDVQAGPAQAVVRCTGAGSVKRALMIVGRLVEPRITVVKQGFSTRPNPGAGTRLSYGLVLHNGSAQKDALGVTVQTNFVLADNNLLGTDTQRIDGIAAGSDYAFGHMITFPGGAPIARLEVVISVGRFAAHAMHGPTLANIHLLPGTFDPNWVGTVEGELQNTDPALTMRSANLSAVVFDSAGNIVGGGTGLALQALPPGAREFIRLASGLDAIPWDHAASTMVSVTSTWQQPGS